MPFKTTFSLFKPKPYAPFKISYAHFKWLLYAKSSPKPGPLCFLHAEAIMTEVQKIRCIFSLKHASKTQLPKVLKTQTSMEYSAILSTQNHTVWTHALSMRNKQPTVSECSLSHSAHATTANNNKHGGPHKRQSSTASLPPQQNTKQPNTGWWQRKHVLWSANVGCLTPLKESRHLLCRRPTFFQL